MALYEHVFLARQDLSQQQVDALVEQYKGVIAANGGSVGRVENWGLKSLTYRVKKNRKAHYSLLNLDAPPPAVAEMERRMGIHPDILRFITVRVEEHETEPSVQMRKSDRDDRRDGERGGFRGGPGGGGFRGDRPGGGFRGDRGPGAGGGFRGDREGGGFRREGGAGRPPRPRDEATGEEA